MSADIKLIQRKITLINRDLKNLERISRVPLAKYLENDEYEALAERYLERIIGRMIDINYHILSSENISPLDYYDSFKKMGEIKILAYNFSRQLTDSAGLRNRLAHEYDEIDSRKVYSAVSRCLKDMPEYLAYVIKFVDKIRRQNKMI